MRKLTFWLLWLFVLSLPWEFFVTIALIGTAGRLLGAAAIATGILTLMVSGKLRRPGIVLYLAFAFALINLLSLLWTISWTASSQRVITYGQLIGLVWLVWEFARSVKEQQSLMIAYFIGAYMSVGDLLRSFFTGQHVAGLRYTGLGFDPNDLGLMLAIGIPMAWHLFLNRKGVIRLLGVTYLPLAVLAILLTASRGAFLSSLVALSIVPLTLPRRSLRSIVMMTVALLVAVTASAVIVPRQSWDRIMSTKEELSSGTLNGRVAIWTAGLRAFQDRPVLGAGAGAFEAAVEPLLGPNNPAHNVFLANLVEQGIVGFLIFCGLLAACGFRLSGLPPPERKVWAVIAFIWVVGAMSLGWQYRKITWLIVGMLAVQVSARTAGKRQAEPVGEDDHRLAPGRRRAGGPAVA